MSELQRYKIVYLGMGGIFSTIPLQALLAAGAEVAAVVWPRPQADQGGPVWLPGAVPNQLPLVQTNRAPDMFGVARAHGIPILSVGDLKDAATLQVMDALGANLLVTACFPRLLPQSWLDMPANGSLNLHPSLLPSYRGPEPLFWQFYFGERRSGITLHFMDVSADSGDIIGQRELMIEVGITEAALDQQLAELGAELLVEAVAAPIMPRQRQPSVGASYYPRPSVADRVVPHTWTARRAYNFMRGAAAWSPFWVETGGGEQLEVAAVLGYSTAVDARQDEGEGLGIDMAGGDVLFVRLVN